MNPLTQNHGRTNMWRMSQPYRKVLIRSVNGTVADFKDVSTGVESTIPALTPDGHLARPGDLWMASVESGSWLLDRMIDPGVQKVTSLEERLARLDPHRSVWAPLDHPTNGTPEVAQGAYLGERRYFEVKPNDRWVNLDGSAISRHRYRDYFDLVGTSFGPGDGSSTFNVDYVPSSIGGGVVAYRSGSASSWTSSSTTTPTDITVTAGDALSISIALSPSRRYKAVSVLNFVTSVAADRPVLILNVDGSDSAYTFGVASSSQGGGVLSYMEYPLVPSDNASHIYKLRGRLGNGGTGSVSLFTGPFIFYIEDTGPVAASAAGWYVCVE